jgi:hypothetical protein
MFLKYLPQEIEGKKVQKWLSTPIYRNWNKISPRKIRDPRESLLLRMLLIQIGILIQVSPTRECLSGKFLLWERVMKDVQEVVMEKILPKAKHRIHMELIILKKEEKAIGPQRIQNWKSSNILRTSRWNC